MPPTVDHLYRKASAGDAPWSEVNEVAEESSRVTFGVLARRVIYNLVAHPDLPKFMFGKKGEWLRTVGVLGTLFLVGGLVAGYIAMQDKELVLLKANVEGLRPTIGEPGQLSGLEVNNQVGIGWGIYPRGEVDWDSMELVAGTDCLVVQGKELKPPTGVTWSVSKREPARGYKAEGVTVETTMEGLLTVITVNYGEVAPEECK